MHTSSRKSSSGAAPGLIALLLMAGALGACGSLSHKVAADGGSAGQLVWPAPDSTISLHKGGTFPNVESLRLIKAGMTKQQITQLVGAPHFNEGVWGVREWNYLFNFRTDGSDAVTQCQYKVLFDEQKLARSFYWQPESCASVLDEKKVASEPEKEQTFVLQTDALFLFDKSDVHSIRAGGRDQLKELALKVGTMPGDVRQIHIAGYTDRIGTDEYNQALSQKRAETVRQVLQDDGVAGERMDAEGRGKADPIADCSERNRKALIACLAPNRRVEVKVEGNTH